VTGEREDRPGQPTSFAVAVGGAVRSAVCNLHLRRKPPLTLRFSEGRGAETADSTAVCRLWGENGGVSSKGDGRMVILPGKSGFVSIVTVNPPRYTPPVDLQEFYRKSKNRDLIKRGVKYE